MGADDGMESGTSQARCSGPPVHRRSCSCRSLAQSIAYQAAHNGACSVMLAAAVAGGWMSISSLLILVDKVILKVLSFG